MSFISYAQNFEDVMLWRALQHIQNGFYIDVGAYSPNDDSVTKAFYDNGWSGINIEPNPELHILYKTKRERDINLQIALSNTTGETDIYFSQNAGLSSLDKTIAQSHAQNGVHVTPSKVTLTTLAHICEQHTKNKAVHFLKVDVEGLEKNVLLGNDWNTLRPWIVLVEATQPMSQVENHQDWEYLLLQADYIFAYADGLNRFYVSKEHQELLVSFNYPPNVFDDFILVEQVKLQNQVQQIANDAQIQLQEAQNQLQDAQAQIQQLQSDYNTLQNSFSCKVTKALRLVKNLFFSSKV